MSFCGVYTLPNGTICCLRSNQSLVAALMLPSLSDAMSATTEARLGLSIDVVQSLYAAMNARTEQEAARVILERDAPRVAVQNGFLGTDIVALTITEEIGLLHPTENLVVNRRFRRCWRRVGAGLPVVDMPLARTQRMNEVRVARQPRLDKCDDDIKKAEDKEDIAQLRNLRVYRQKLRDLPATEKPNVDAITKPEVLAAWEPTWPVSP